MSTIYMTPGKNIVIKRTKHYHVSINESNKKWKRTTMKKYENL